jgi:hypothetical protein
VFEKFIPWTVKWVANIKAVGSYEGERTEDVRDTRSY